MGLFKDMVKSYSSVKTKEKMDYDQLFAVMKGGTYPLGEPQLSGEGIMRAIRFDPTGKYQVMVSIAGKKITIAKTYSGAKGLGKEIIGDTLTDGWFSGLNSENISGNQAVEAIGKEIARLLEEKGQLGK